MDVFCSMSKLSNAGFAIIKKDPYKEQPSESTREYILSDVFHEQADYRTLLNAYSDALKGNENIYFSFAVFCDKRHAVRIDEEGNILLYFYQDTPEVYVPWDYPHLITRIGTVAANTAPRSVLKDFQKNKSALDYLLEYYIGVKKTEYRVEEIPEGYLINDFLKILIDTHITFQWTDSMQNQHEQYIADVWAHTKKEILKDLTTMSLLKFGKIYHGFWGR